MINAYKGFNRDMTCRDFKYKEGKKYITPKAKCCFTGFHACEYPLDCLNYYYPGDESMYHEVELDGDIDHYGGNTKVAATKIKIGARLSIAGLVKAAIDYTMARIKPGAKADENHAACSATDDGSACSATGNNSACSATGCKSACSATGCKSACSATGCKSACSATGDYSACSATGDYSACSATGFKSACSATDDGSACSATGDYSACSATGFNSACSATGFKSACSATGYRSACSATGNGSACSATGDYSACSATGNGSACSADNPTAIAVAWGLYSRAKGVIGAHIVLADWRQDKNFVWLLHGAKMVRIDGKRYKADTWYTLKNGKVKEVADGE